jgi:hypothetical protein
VPATFLWFLFDWRGRIGRSPYRIAWLVVALFAASLDYLPVKGDAFLASIAALQLVVALALDSKRLHDIGLSAIWLAATSVAGVALAAALVFSVPDLAPVLSEKLSASIGAGLAASPALCIAVAGTGLGAAMRAPFLWVIQSRDAGAAYDYDPRARARAAASEIGKISAGAEAALAQALIDKQLQEIAAAAGRTGGAQGKPARKTFGRRPA